MMLTILPIDPPSRVPNAPRVRSPHPAHTGARCRGASTPSRKPGDRVKTDRRDATTLAHLHRGGELTRVWVPAPDWEAVRDLTRAREDMKAMEVRTRQRLGAFLLRHGRVYDGKSRWTQAHFRWLEEQKFDFPVQQTVFQEYVDAAVAAQKRTDGLARDRLGGAEASVCPVCEALRTREGEEQGGHGDRARACRLHLGHRL